jgi:hypothetical protein
MQGNTVIATAISLILLVILKEESLWWNLAVTTYLKTSDILSWVVSERLFLREACVSHSAVLMVGIFLMRAYPQGASFEYVWNGQRGSSKRHIPRKLYWC